MMAQGPRRHYSFHSESNWVRMEEESLPGVVYAEWQEDPDGRRRVVQLVVDCGPFGAGTGVPITSETLRLVKVADLERMLNTPPDGWTRGSEHRRAALDGPNPGHELRQHFGVPRSRVDWAEADARRFRLRVMPPNGRLTDEYLGKVVRAYHAAVEAGEYPAPSIARDCGASERTVRSWVRKARDRGLMAPGRAGHLG